MPGDAGIQPRAGEQRAPFRGAEAAGDRDRAVQAHDAMPARGAAEEAKAVIWQRVAMQVGDDPAASACALEPKQERHHLIVGEVVGKLRADDEVRLGLRRLVEHIAGLPGDHGAGRGGSHGLDGAAWIEVDAREHQHQPAPCGPAMKAPQQIGPGHSRRPATTPPGLPAGLATNGTAETCSELSISPSFEEAADDLSNPSFVSEKEPWTRTESPDRRRRSRAQSRRWSARRRAMPSSMPKEKPTRLRARFRTPSAASKTHSNQQLRRG